MNCTQMTAHAAIGKPLETEGVGRDIGIPEVGMAPWGTHVCQFFATQQDLLDIIVPFMRAGLKSNEVSVWLIAPTLSFDEAAEALDREVGDIEHHVAQGQLVMMPVADWYGTENFDWQQLMAPVVPAIETAVSHGYAGIRATADLSWVEPQYWDTFMTYEEAMNQHMTGRRMLGLCSYSLEFNAAHLVDVLMRHQFALIKHQDWTLIEPSAQKRATAAVEQMNQALAERTTELQAALADLRGFSRWVTHDLRAPLRSVHRFSDLLAETVESKMDDDERHLFERIQSSTDRMDTLITDILAYSTAQQNALHPQSLNLGTLTQRVWETLDSTLNDRHVELQILPMPRAPGDRAMLTQVLTNLLNNAIKFTAKKAAPHIEVGTRTVEGECAYYVRDNGEGFDPAHADKIFGAFERLHGKAEYEGTGLGLTIVKQIITRHGGRIWAEATPGAGATFTFTLPTPRTDDALT